MTEGGASLRDVPRAVLIVGPYGSGKSTVAVEVADILERLDEPFALLDLDHLMWANPPGISVHDDPSLLLLNLAAVTRTYREVGIQLFVCAGYVGSAEELHAIRTTLDMPVTVVHLEVPWREIERRLMSVLTSGREDDLREAAAQSASGTSSVRADMVVRNDRLVSEAAVELVQRLGWDTLRSRQGDA